MTSTDDYSYLWDGSEEGWVLISFTESTEPLIYNEMSHEALIIDDSELHREIVSIMVANGKELLSDMPPRNQGN